MLEKAKNIIVGPRFDRQKANKKFPTTLIGKDASTVDL